MSEPDANQPDTDSAGFAARYHLRMAHARFARSEWQEALEEVSAALAARPDNAEALQLKGETLWQLGRRVEAATALDAAGATQALARLAKGDPAPFSASNVPEFISSGRLQRLAVLRRSGMLQSALGELDAVLEQAQQGAAPILAERVTGSVFDLAMAPDAEVAATDRLASLPASPAAALVLALIEIIERRPDAAIAPLDAVERWHGSTPLATILRGLAAALDDTRTANRLPDIVTETETGRQSLYAVAARLATAGDTDGVLALHRLLGETGNDRSPIGEIVVNTLIFLEDFEAGWTLGESLYPPGESTPSTLLMLSQLALRSGRAEAADRLLEQAMSDQAATGAGAITPALFDWRMGHVLCWRDALEDGFAAFDRALKAGARPINIAISRTFHELRLGRPVSATIPPLTTVEKDGLSVPLCVSYLSGIADQAPPALPAVQPRIIQPASPMTLLVRALASSHRAPIDAMRDAGQACALAPRTAMVHWAAMLVARQAGERQQQHKWAERARHLGLPAPDATGIRAAVSDQ